MKATKTAPKKHRRGPTSCDTNYVQAYNAYIDTLPSVPRATFKAHLQIDKRNARQVCRKRVYTHATPPEHY